MATWSTKRRAAEHWPAFRERLEERGGSLPGFVRDELEAFITCGDFEYGFLEAQRARSGDNLRVPFACESRGICPSCIGRRMAGTAALLPEHRFPEVPWRQWVLSFEGPMAMRLGYDRPLLGRDLADTSTSRPRPACSRLSYVMQLRLGCLG